MVIKHYFTTRDGITALCAGCEICVPDEGATSGLCRTVGLYPVASGSDLTVSSWTTDGTTDNCLIGHGGATLKCAIGQTSAAADIWQQIHAEEELTKVMRARRMKLMKELGLENDEALQSATHATHPPALTTDGLKDMWHELLSSEAMTVYLFMAAGGLWFWAWLVDMGLW